MGYAESFAEFDRWSDTLRLTLDDDLIIDAIEKAIRHEADPERLGILHGLLHQEYVGQCRPDAAAAIAGLHPEAVRVYAEQSRARRKSSAGARRRLDEMILHLVKPRWLKVAHIVARVLHTCERDAFATSGSQIARRIASLVAGGALDARGNLARWRFSEVRLHDKKAAHTPERDNRQDALSAELANAPVIANRTLTMKIGRRDVEVPITIHAPVDKGDHWRCYFAIGWPDKPKGGIANGIDAFQALFIALKFIAANLYTSGAHDADRLRWAGRRTGYGFPLSWTLRALAEGEDRFL